MKNKESTLQRILRISPSILPGVVAGAIVGITVAVAQGTISQTSALSVSSKRDCDSNAVINCGALTTTELQQRYSQKGVADIYRYFGISAAAVTATSKTAVAGQVYKDGTVKVGNVTVATGAITAGRENIDGSTKVSMGSTIFYTRPPSVSFRSTSLAAFVIMENGQFKFAVLAACGNPVKATPVPKPVAKPTVAPKPAVKPPAEEPTPPVAQPVTPTPPASTQTPPSTPTATLVSAPAAAPEVLPVVGPAAILTVAGFSVAGGYIFHMTHRHVRHRRAR